ncbi:hypothetical protein PanWU01x14_041970 [Parasponia andersonii]|uniref:Uncharacterized protein n=1 Tax=Parasponia andersonii TaxID=3476 RepID=A0A2P5DQK3_PARAD|nr:hypothetical protein PanWU01x14_041970 [Parasponia andersonii]
MVMALNHLPHSLHQLHIQGHLLKPGSRIPHLPLLISLWPLHPLHTLPCHHIHHVPPEHLLLEHQPVLVFSGQAGLEHVEQRREMEERFSEPGQEEGRVVCPIHDAMDEHVRLDAPYQSKHRVSRAVLHYRLVRQVLHPVQTVYHSELVPIEFQVFDPDGFPFLRYHVVLEWHIESLAVVGQSQTRLVDTFGRSKTRLWKFNSCEAEPRWPAGSFREALD